MTTNTSIGSTSATLQNLINTVNGTSDSSTSSSSTSNSSSASSLQSTFLQLLITQLKNQDPTNPTDSSQLTSQLAQINTVSGISQLNSTLTSLASQLTAQQQTQSANLIGATVLTPGTSVSVSSGSITPFGVTLSGAATDVKVTVTNSAGQLVNTINLGKESAGTVPVTWKPVDASGNTLANGTYTISATATIAGAQATPSTVTGSTIEGVLPQTTGTPNLVLSNGNTVNLSSVAGIL
ncbi:flagellar hook assembly protein FlgD [Trinickia terrae]|uniref:Basal-body rod modification protein FlgD n=1 Tax=Trinickia terrae TaxID=2571161 RepID=A0A4U1I783_9BURK|nr:flagellar hook assembly protein FlgD [Trinickia terrae]TKC89262.1 flagellar hook assembly protein FlgD [Trinickia terrae]